MSGLSRRIDDNFDMLQLFRRKKVLEMKDKKNENGTTHFLQKIVMDYSSKTLKAFKSSFTCALKRPNKSDKL